MEKQKTYFETLNSVDCSGKTEQKNGLTYLSWAWSWAELKKRYPMSYYTVYENAQGWNYHTDGKTCWVKTGVTVVWDEVIDDDYTTRKRVEIEHIEYLPVMDFKNKSIPADQVTSFDVNKAIQRSLTKAVARHGLGLYIYAGEDLPEEVKPATKEQKKTLMTTCESMGLNYEEILAQTGWKKGDVFTADHYEKSLIVLSEISESRNEAERKNGNPKSR